VDLDILHGTPVELEKLEMQKMIDAVLESVMSAELHPIAVAIRDFLTQHHHRSTPQ
jgi:hypothetical protein